MAAFYYGSCPSEGLLWRCECDGRNIEICPFDKARTDKSTEETWATIEDSASYGGEWRDHILQSTIDLQITSISVYGESGAVVPDPISSTPFRRFIKMLSEGVPVAEYYFHDGTGRFFGEGLSREQRIKKFLNNAVPYIWYYVQKCVHKEKDNNENCYLNAVKSIKSYSTKNINDPVNHPSHYQLHGGMEVIDIIEAVTWDLPSNEAYAIGNAIKYICRYRNKYKPVQDLEKAKWYLNRTIEDYKKREEGD